MTKKPARQTLERVRVDPRRQLFLSLYENARKLLESNHPPHTSNPTLQDLERVLDTVARQKFLRNYGYAYQDAQSKPKNPNIKNLSALNALLNISSDNDPQIVNYVQFLLNATNVKSKAALDTSRAQLVEQGRLLFRAPIQDSWTALPFDKSYDEPEPEKNPWKTDMTMVQCNAALTIDGQGAKYTFIFFVGVYYEVISEQALKARLFKILLDNAKKLPSAATGFHTLDVQSLQAVLLEAAKKKFLTDYEVEFKGNATRPKDLAIGKERDVRGTSAIYYLPDNDPPTLKVFIETNILSAIEFGRNDVMFAADVAYSGLERQLTDVLKNSTGNSWLSSTFSQIYNNHSLTQMSLRTISVLLYTRAALTDGPFTTKATFVSYLGVYYHVESPEDKAINTLLAKLYESARWLYNPPTPLGPPYSTRGLEQILDNWGILRFKATYSVPFEGDNTVPKDLLPPDVTSWTLTSNMNTVVIANDEWDDLDATIDALIFSGLIIPEWLRDIAIAELDKAFRLAKRVAVDGSIKSAKFNKVYKDYLSPFGFDWKSASILTYTNGTLTEGDVKVTRTFINFVGVFYPINPLGLKAAAQVSAFGGSEASTFAAAPDVDDFEEGFFEL